MANGVALSSSQALVLRTLRRLCESHPAAVATDVSVRANLGAAPCVRALSHLAVKGLVGSRWEGAALLWFVEQPACDSALGLLLSAAPPGPRSHLSALAVQAA